MQPEIIAATAISAGNPGGLIASAIIILIVFIPLVLKIWNWSKEVGAQGVLYQQLAEQVREQRKEIDKMYSERVQMQTNIFELRHKVDNYEVLINTLKDKLDKKDSIITERDSRIAGLMQELLQMKDRVHNLEMRLKSDEERWCETCKYNIEGARYEQN